MWFVGHLVHEAPTATLLCADMCRPISALGVDGRARHLSPSNVQIKLRDFSTYALIRTREQSRDFSTVA